MKVGVRTQRRVRCPHCANSNHDKPEFVVSLARRGKVRCPRCRCVVGISGSACRG